MRWLVVCLVVAAVECSRQHPLWYADNDLAKRAQSTREGATITLLPSGATFQVSKGMLEWHQEFANNLHLSPQELDAVACGAGEWDTEYASVCNAVLPFDRCAAHVGDEGWGAQSVSFTGLQVRIYDMDDSPEAVEAKVEKDGAADAARWARGAPQILSGFDGPWQSTMISFGVSYGDYGGTANVDFRSRRFGQRTFVFVFMYAGSQPHGEIPVILDSFHAP
jgi:hypothetical protein